jgi:hypothetical protein
MPHARVEFQMIHFVHRCAQGLLCALSCRHDGTARWAAQETSMRITRINHFEAKAGCETKLFDFLQSVIVIIKNAKGCSAALQLRSNGHPTQPAIIEEWYRIAEHQNAAKAIQLEKMQLAMAPHPSGRWRCAYPPCLLK